MSILACMNGGCRHSTGNPGDGSAAALVNGDTRLAPPSTPDLETGFSFTELLVVITCLAVLAILVLPGFRRARVGSRISCANNVKQIGLSFRVWSLDHNDHFPMEMAVLNGGTRELIDSGAVWPHFQVMSNELSTPKVLVCPHDKARKAATNFTFLTDAQVSYFLNIDSTLTNPNALLCGDRNLTNKPVVGRPFARVSAETPIGWDKHMHGGKGVICLANGSVAWYTNGSSALCLTIPEGVTNRLAIP